MPGARAEAVPAVEAGRLLLALVGSASLGTALLLRYGIIQNTPLGLACEAGRGGFVCALRLAVILLFVFNVFGWGALIAAAVQLIRPNVLVLGIGLVFALAGLVLYNTGACGACDRAAPAQPGAARA